MSRLMREIETGDRHIDTLLERLIDQLVRFVQRLQSAKIYAELTAIRRDRDTIDFTLCAKIEGVGTFRSYAILIIDSLDVLHPAFQEHAVEETANYLMSGLLAEMFITPIAKPIVQYTPSGQRLAD